MRAEMGTGMWVWAEAREGALGAGLSQAVSGCAPYDTGPQKHGGGSISTLGCSSARLARSGVYMPSS